MKQMPLGNVWLNSIEGVISIGFQLLTAMLNTENISWDE